MREDEPDVLIVGGGIGGLAAAALLNQAGIPSLVCEQAKALAEVGAGIVIAPNAARVLRQLGVLDVFRHRAVRLEAAWEFRRWEDGTILSSERLVDTCVGLYGEETYTAHRADLLDAVRSAVPEEFVRLGRRCVEVDLSNDTPLVRFSDGSVCRPKVLVGADGIHSIVRGSVTEVTPATYSGLCAFRSLVPAASAPAFARRPAQTLWLGPGHHLVHYPVSGGDSVNLVAFAPAGDDSVESWTATATVSDFLAEFEGWDPRLSELIAASGVPGRWALLDRAPLPRWSTGRTTLLGDAAHPMFPFFAQGAAQAMEDAAVLALCLAEGFAEPEAALRRYEALRTPRANRLQELSRGRAAINHLPDGEAQRSRDAAFGAADPLVANGWIYGYDASAADA